VRDPGGVAVAVDIDALDSEVRAFVERAPVDDRAPTKGPLAGTSVGVKDLFRVDGYATRAGSRLPEALFEGPESAVVMSLKKAGAVVVGKTAMDEFAYCEPPDTRNPRDLRRTPGGSSGGSAAAVAARMCDLAVGSQTLQSIIVPASYCGVIGFKPTFDRVRFDGVPLAPSFDTVGLLAADLNVIAAAASVVVATWRPVEPPVRRPVLGVPTPWGIRRLHQEGWTFFRRHVQTLEAAGFEVRNCDVPWSSDTLVWGDVVGDLLRGEMWRVHERWFEQYADLYRPRTAAAVERGRGVSAARLDECRTAQVRTKSLLDDAAAVAGIDCWISPSVGSIAPIGYDLTGDSWMTCFWSFAGRPCISLPVFDGDQGLPHGLQVVGATGDDEDLIAWASQIAASLA